MAFGTVLAYVNAFLIGVGANLWGNHILFLGLAAAFISTPVFWYRHYIVDKGQFPPDMLDDLLPEGQTTLPPTRAGILPYVALAGGIFFCGLGYAIFWTGIFN